MRGSSTDLDAAAGESLVVRRLCVFTEWVGVGRKLTQTGRITLADARVLVALLETGDVIDPKIGDRVFKTKSSEELRGLEQVVEWAKAAGLVRVVKGRLVPVKKSVALLDRPQLLWDRAFEVYPRLGAVMCAAGWFQSMLREEFERVVPKLLIRLYGGPVTIGELCSLAWDLASAPFVLEDVTGDRLSIWRRSDGRDTIRAFEMLAELGAVHLTGSDAEDTVELCPLGLAALRRRLGEAGPGDPVYQVKVTLLETADPVVWRRLRVSARIRLDRLHKVIQAVMGWQDCHLHMFVADDVRYGEYEPELELCDHRVTSLSDLVSGEGTRIEYVYDFGDGWDHEILVEKVFTAGNEERCPVLVDGEGACPPEDCGGVWGYARLREVLADVGDDEHEDMLNWLGLSHAAEFDPALFNPDHSRKVLTEIF
jgi:Plasmid pRiA4b ORF-3-like protein